MKVNEEGKTEVVEYNSLSEFYDYITNTPLNSVFRWSSLSSVKNGYSFTQTHSFDEATSLLKNGWSDMASKLTQKLKVAEAKVQPMMKARNTMSVAGYQAIVPLYLNGVPNNMINKKMTPVKQKVVTLNKSINYNCGVKTSQIVEESIKAMQIVKKLEAQGYRCNLNVILGISEKDKQIIVKVRIKSANEKMNVSKLAFPLVHPSMLRRLLFRFIEVYPTITESFKHGYGHPISEYEMKNLVKKDGEYLLSNFINVDVTKIKSIDDLQNIGM